MELRDVFRNIQPIGLVLALLCGQALALSDIDLKAIYGTLIPVAIILFIIAVIFIIRYYKKLQEVQKEKKRKDARDMMKMRDAFPGHPPQSGISSVSGTRIPEIMVNGKPNPEFAPVKGKNDWGWTPENGQLKRPAPVLPSGAPPKPASGVAKKVSNKKKGKNPTPEPTLPYPAPFKQSLFSKNNPLPPFEDQMVTVDMVSEAGDDDDRGQDNDVFIDVVDEKPPTPDRERKAFILKQLEDMNKQDVHETHMKSDGTGPDTPKAEDFIGQVNEDEIKGETDPKRTIPSEVYYNERLYNSMDRPRPVKPGTPPPELPEAEIKLELVEMVDFSSLVHSQDIDDAYARLEAKQKEIPPEVTAATLVVTDDGPGNNNDFNVQCTADNILEETRQGRVLQQRNPTPPPIPYQPPHQIFPIPAPVAQPLRGPPPPHRDERPKSLKSNKSSKSAKSNKSSKSNKSNKSKKSNKKMVPRRYAPKRDFVGQCFEDDITRETGYGWPRHDDNIYAAVQRPRTPEVPSKNFEDTRRPYPGTADEDTGELLIPDMGLFDKDEEALRHHHVRVKRPSEGHSPYHERHDSGGSLSDEHHLSADAEEKVNAAFASIFRDHSRGLTSDSSEDELDRPRSPMRRPPPTATGHQAPPPPPPPPPPPVASQNQKDRGGSPEPVPSTSGIGPNVERDRLRHDESHDPDSETHPGSGGVDIEDDYEHNWGKLTDDTLPKQDY